MSAPRLRTAAARTVTAATSWRAVALFIGLLALATFLRFRSLEVGWLGVDQGRDLAWAEHIAAGDRFPAVGPLMRNRLHLGATYYYFWALPALLVAPGAYPAYAFAALLGVGAVAGAGWLARGIAGREAGLVALALLATSPIAVLDSRIAWAPAALPPACALLLLLASSYLAAPSIARAAAIAMLSSFATQLHLAAGALLPVAAGALVARWRALGARGLAIAAAIGAIPLVPMALAWRVPVPGSSPTAFVDSPTAYRLGDFLALGARWLEGLSPPATALPLPIELWLRVEAAAGWLPLAAGAVALSIAARVRDPAGLRLAVGCLATCVAIPLLLPAEVWGYYLDAALVPGAIVIGVVATRPAWRTIGIILVAVACAARTAFLVWWLSAAASQGYVAANLDFLRLGGPRPAAPEARARLLGFAVKQEVADVLARDLGIAPGRIWQDVHGPAFADLDTDNGYVLGRSVAPRDGATAEHGLLLYGGELDPSWLAAFAPPRRVGPLEVFHYAPLLRIDRAALSGCSSGEIPFRSAPDPLDYGAGEAQLPRWPCDRPVVQVPFDAPPPGTAVRVFPRVVGQGRVLAVAAEPVGSGVPEHANAPGLGAGALLGPAAGVLRIELAIDGPAALDLVELHGRPPAAEGPSSSATDRRSDATAADVG